MEKDKIDLFIETHNKLVEIQDFYVTMSNKLADFIALESLRERNIDLENKEQCWRAFLEVLKTKVDRHVYEVFAKKCRMLLLLPSADCIVIGTTDELFQYAVKVEKDAIASSVRLAFGRTFELRFVLEKGLIEPKDSYDLFQLNKIRGNNVTNNNNERSKKVRENFEKHLHTLWKKAREQTQNTKYLDEESMQDLHEIGSQLRGDENVPRQDLDLQGDKDNKHSLDSISRNRSGSNEGEEDN